MSKPLLIVGHGLAGCVIGLTCYRKGIPFTMIGCSQPGEASNASSGLIAPITGRRYVKAWKIDEFISSALDFYRWSEELLKKSFFFPVEIVRYLSNPEATAAWEKRLEDPEYSAYISDKKYNFLEDSGRPYGILTGGYRLDTLPWLTAVKEFLLRKGLLKISNEMFQAHSSYSGKIIFATGAVDPAVSQGIIPNKGEALIVRMKDWKIPLIVKDEVFIVPMLEKDLYWVGSYYLPWPKDPFPSAEGRELILKSLNEVYNGDIEVIEHVAGVRPTIDDRRPLIGSFPGHPHQFIFNGMGTKGTSLAPFWAEQLLSHILEDQPLPPQVSPSRYYQ